jgi:LytS/YehU family sensor histidine kinase
MLISQNELTIPENQSATKLADLELFKMLLQPHFLFNSLNNLYALSIKKSDQTADAIAGLSELLEKVVSSSRMEYIPLSQEVELIRDYIKLERIWLGETTFLLDFQVTGDIDQIIIPPLLLYTFVENCFKHGIRKCAGDGWSTIKIEVKKGNLYFTAKNQVPVWDEEKNNTEKKHSGLGVIAAKELLNKKCCGKYELKNALNGNVYCVDLRISQLSKISA